MMALPNFIAVSSLLNTQYTTREAISENLPTFFSVDWRFIRTALVYSKRYSIPVDGFRPLSTNGRAASCYFCSLVQSKIGLDGANSTHIVRRPVVEEGMLIGG